VIGPGYWYTGAMCEFTPDGKVGAYLDFYDDGFAQDGSTEGRLRVRHLVDRHALVPALRLLIEDAARLGLRPTSGDFSPTLYVHGDGEDASVFLPHDWRAILRSACTEIGWRYLYGEAN